MVIRILEPIFLGCISNVIVNILFNPGESHWVPAEFLVACVLAAVITELNRYIDRRLESRTSWIVNPLRRLSMHFLLIVACLLVILNVVGGFYMWITGSGFFSAAELLIINSVVFALALFLTAVKWSVQFYSRWVHAEKRASTATLTTEALMSTLSKSKQVIEVQQGMARTKIEVHAIRLARLEFGTVRIYTTDGQSGVFSGTLTQLYSRMPEHIFFQASRDTILHRDLVKKTSSSTFGKVLVTIDDPKMTEVMVSRPKAAAFRKWLDSSSVPNQ